MADVPPGLKDLINAAQRALHGDNRLSAADVARLRAQLAQQAGQGGPVTRRMAMAGGAAIVGSMAGQGGINPPPLNAPGAGQVGYGVQPGSPGVVVAHFVIITGTAGGWFIYNGAPSLGNPPIAWGTNGTKDPYGNTLPYQSTLGIASTATFSAGDTLITPTGQFTYSSTPGAGLLIASITPAAGTDPFSDVTQKGVNAYVVIGGVRYAVGLNQTGTALGLPGVSMQDTANVPTLPAGLFGGASSNGSATYKGWVELHTGQATGADYPAQLIGESQTQSGVTHGTYDFLCGAIQFGVNTTATIDDNNNVMNFGVNQASPPAPGSGFSINANANGNPAWINAAGQAGAIPLTKSVQGGNTNNTTSLNALFTAQTIPANDAKQNTVYRFTCGGHGTQATGTAVALNFQLFAFGLAWGLSADTGGVIAGGNFHWRFVGELIIGTPGANAPASFFGEMTISQSSASAQGHPTAMDQQRASGVDTTTATNGTFQAGWASTTGSPTIVCTGGMMERMGP